jgi:hypothetical protein
MQREERGEEGREKAGERTFTRATISLKRSKSPRAALAACVWIFWPQALALKVSITSATTAERPGSPSDNVICLGSAGGSS